MSEGIKFSIITVCKNPGDEFIITLESLKLQTYSNFEWIVVDGMSTDGTREKIEQHRNLIAKSIAEPDHGIYDAMNKGVAMASGDYVYFLNCGDTFSSKDVLSEFAAHIDPKNDEVVYGNACLVDPTSNRSTIKSHDNVDKYYLFNRPINHQSLFVRRSLFNSIGLFDTQYVVKADHEWTIRCKIGGCRFRHVPMVVSNYVLRGFAFQNRSKYRAKEKKKIQNRYFNWIGRYLVRVLNRFNVTPGASLRSVLNKLL